MPSSCSHTVRFGPFQLDLRAAELSHNGSKTKLAEQPFLILTELVEHPGEVVTRDELRQRLWHSDTFVDFEHGLNTAVKRLREALGDSAENPRYIETLPRHGYRLMVPVESAEPAPAPTSEPRVHRWKIWLASSVVAVVVVALGASLVWRQHSPRLHALTASDTIVLADFINTTGDAVFDDTLKQALTVQLEQSPFLNIVSQTKVQDTLRLMGRSADARLTPELGRELCQRTGSKALLFGSIGSLGSQYVIGMTATGCGDGNLLAIEQIQAANKEDVLKALGKASSSLRSKLGESLSSVQKFDAPIEEATTPSLEALKAYSLGVKAHFRVDYPSAVAFFQRAIMLDPNFAMAYGDLAIVYDNTGESKREAESLQKAYELRDRVSDRERLFLTSSYQHGLLGDLESARKTYEIWTEMYPRDFLPWNRLGTVYDAVGDHEKAIVSYKESLRRDPTGLVYANLIAEYRNLNQFDEAKATAREAEARHLDIPVIHRDLYKVAFLEHDAGGMEREAAVLLSQPNWHIVRMEANLESEAAAFAGQFGKARELTRRAISLAERDGDKELAANDQACSALPEALVGDLLVAKREAKAALALSNGKDIEICSALALGMAGERVQAARLAADLARRYPQDTIMQSVNLPTIHAVVTMQGGTIKDNEKAITTLAAAAPYEFGAWEGFPVYLRGLAYLDSHQPPSAVIEFRKILDHPGIVGIDIVGPLTRLQLGRAYAMFGDTTKAKVAYQDFLTLWKDADPDIPILKEAKAEYAKLQ